MPPLIRHSFPSDRDHITTLLKQTHGIPGTNVALHPEFQNWKYWGPHPWFAESRSRLLEDPRAILAHVCIWPIRLQTLDGSFSAFHPIDWGARRDFPGGGLQV